MKWIAFRHRIAVLAIAAAFMAVSAWPGQAYLGKPWGAYPTDTVGTCTNCISRGNYVRGVQMLMWAGHFYGNMYTSNVDGVYGTNTRNAIISYQATTGLTQDGFVGFKTWTNLWYRNVYTGSDAGWGGEDNYYWQRNHPELIGNHWIHCPNGFLFDWFNGQRYWIENGWNGSSGPPACVVGP